MAHWGWEDPDDGDEARRSLWDRPDLGAQKKPAGRRAGFSARALARQIEAEWVEPPRPDIGNLRAENFADVEYLRAFG